MGVIKRQGIKNSIVSYVGVLIGAINVLFIYPLSETTLEAYGLLRFIMDTSLLLMPFVLLGMNSLTIRFFPTFKNAEKGHHGFLLNLLIGSGVGILLFIAGFLLLKNQIEGLFADKDLIRQFVYYLIPFTCLIGLIDLLTLHVSNFHRIVVPAILNLLVKITLPALIILYYHQQIGIASVVHGTLLNFVVVFVFLLAYLKSLGQLKLKPDFQFLQKPILREMGTYALYGIFGLLGSMLATRIDTFMIGTLLGELDTGTYGILLFIATVIEIPRVALMKITLPIVSETSNKGNMSHLEFLYKKTSINLLIPGAFLFICIFTNLESLFAIMPNGERFIPYQNIVLVIALAKIVDMATSINNQIIGYSKYFRFNFYAILFLAVFNIITNLIFIPVFHILGAALATLASIVLFNLLKCLYVHKKFKMHPFSKNTFWVLLFGTVTFFLTQLLPSTGWALLDIVLRVLFSTLIFGGGVLYFKLSTDINDLIVEVLKKIKRRN